MADHTAICFKDLAQRVLVPGSTTNGRLRTDAPINNDVHVQYAMRDGIATIVNVAAFAVHAFDGTFFGLNTDVVAHFGCFEGVRLMVNVIGRALCITRSSCTFCASI